MRKVVIILTFDGIFEKCKTLEELHMKAIEMRKKQPDELSQWDITRAYRKRRQEIRDKWKEGCFG